LGNTRHPFHARIALFHRRHDDSIPAFRYARGIGEWAIIAGLNSASRRAAIATLGIPVIALLTAFEHPVAAGCSFADAEFTRNALAAIGHDLTVARTAVTVGGIAVVTHLTQGNADQAIAAARGLFAGCTGLGANPASLELTMVTATVPRQCVSVIAVFSWLNALVAAN
jgi:hypothetical protein